MVDGERDSHGVGTVINNCRWLWHIEGRVICDFKYQRIKVLLAGC